MSRLFNGNCANTTYLAQKQIRKLTLAVTQFVGILLQFLLVHNTKMSSVAPIVCPIFPATKSVTENYYSQYFTDMFRNMFIDILVNASLIDCILGQSSVVTTTRTDTQHYLQLAERW